VDALVVTTHPRLDRDNDWDTTSIPSEMAAVVIHEFGDPSVLRLEKVPTPHPSSGEVLVRVHTVSVNRVYDLDTRRGAKLPELVRFPRILGVDPTGDVVQVGAGVTGLTVGDRVASIGKLPCMSCEACRSHREVECASGRVLGVAEDGGYAEYIALPANAVHRIPSGISYSDANFIFRHFPAAFHLLRREAKLRHGEWVLIMGASGALATAGVQVAKLTGASVIAAAGSSERVAIAKSFGADFGIDYSANNLAEEVMRITNGRGVDVVFENVGEPRLWDGAFGSLARGGRLVTAGAHGGGRVMLDVHRLYLRRLTIIGSAGFRKEDVDTTVRAAAEGRIRAGKYTVMPLSDAKSAHQLLETNRSAGKILLAPTMTSGMV
jgi:NADPH:quinone reductase-like Zn-dependent oxidoreductase